MPGSSTASFLTFLLPLTLQGPFSLKMIGIDQVSSHYKLI
jgi:hypothetical protein